MELSELKLNRRYKFKTLMPNLFQASFSNVTFGACFTYNTAMDAGYDVAKTVYLISTNRGNLENDRPDLNLNLSEEGLKKGMFLLFEKSNEDTSKGERKVLLPAGIIDFNSVVEDDLMFVEYYVSCNGDEKKSIEEFLKRARIQFRTVVRE